MLTGTALDAYCRALYAGDTATEVPMRPHPCPRCGKLTEGAYSDGGIRWWICEDCLDHAEEYPMKGGTPPPAEDKRTA